VGRAEPINPYAQMYREYAEVQKPIEERKHKFEDDNMEIDKKELKQRRIMSKMN